MKLALLAHKLNKAQALLKQAETENRDRADLGLPLHDEQYINELKREVIQLKHRLAGRLAA